MMRSRGVEPALASRSNLALAAAAIPVGIYLWSWWTFSGPFRSLIDLELLLLGGYWELGTGVMLGIAAAVAAYCAWLLGIRASDRIPPRLANTVVAVLMVALSAAALLTAWRIYKDTISLPGRQDPVRLVDLNSAGKQSLSSGHAQLIGVAVRQYQVTTEDLQRRGRGGHLDIWLPLRGQSEPALSPFSVVATSRTARGGAAKAIPDNPDGVLLTNALDTRTLYELRRKGLNLIDEPAVLYWPGDTIALDGYINAALLVAAVAVVWVMVAHNILVPRRPKERGPVPRSLHGKGKHDRD